MDLIPPSARDVYAFVNLCPERCATFRRHTADWFIRNLSPFVQAMHHYGCAHSPLRAAQIKDKRTGLLSDEGAVRIQWNVFLSIAYKVQLCDVLDLVPPEMFTTKLICLSKIKGSGKVNKESDIRPIGVSNAITKVFEKAYMKWTEQLPSVFQANEEQAGCAPGRSTLEHVYALMISMQNDWNNPRCTAVYAFMDLHAAFDRVLRRHFIPLFNNRLKQAKAPRVLSDLFSNWVYRQHQ